MTREQLKYCSTIVKDLKKHRDSAPFLVPVDPVLLNIPDYPSIIKRPMDLSTVERKLNSVEYESVDDFVADINLIFSNCYIYNGTESIVSKCASNLEAAFNRLLRRMPREKVPAAPKPKKESIKKEERKEPKLVPLQLVTPSATGPSALQFESPLDTSEERRPKREVQAPSKEIHTGVSSKRKGSNRWKTDPQLRHCHAILKEFAKKSNAEFMYPFMEPVDWEALQIPDYPRIIKNPMDIGSIRQKLESDQYDNAGEFEADVRLVLYNCYKFNPEGTVVNSMGRRMEQLFNNKWAQLPLPPPTLPSVEEVAVDSEDSDSEDSDSSGMFSLLPLHLKTLSEKLETMKATKKKEKGDKKSTSKAPQEKNRHKKTSSAKKSRTVHTSSDEDVTITFEQKKELSDRINDLEGDQLAKVVQIIHDSMPHLRDSGGQEEIELDMDSLDPRTLYKLYQYVRSSTKHKRPVPKKVAVQYSEEDATKKINELERKLQYLDQPAYGKGRLRAPYLLRVSILLRLNWCGVACPTQPLQPIFMSAVHGTSKGDFSSSSDSSDSGSDSDDSGSSSD
ncbi:Bromodomain-containing protein [Gamsiella multidivaricata]|uniref:Bromodomain-containing protein n=1 Tax=Gamsiella multidivaricata TaxID=101098 RepID=UPI00221F1131|nr:Bromodomain-containing protein [Gamsiella multidivaricata]KAI7819147.1 Bromodomain-containing protein [Gamsiella multidivaricata]